MSSRKANRSSQGSREGKYKHSDSAAARRQPEDHDLQQSKSDRPSPKHLMHDLSYWLGRLQVKEDDAKSFRAWKQQNNESTYEVLSQPVRHELNKFFFDVTSTPSKAQRKQLWYDLQMIDSSVRMSKITRWFQNKRQYMKKQYGAPESTFSAAGGSQRSTRPKPKRLKSSDASESDADSDQDSNYGSHSEQLESDSD